MLVAAPIIQYISPQWKKFSICQISTLLSTSDSWAQKCLFIADIYFQEDWAEESLKLLISWLTLRRKLYTRSCQILTKIVKKRGRSAYIIYVFRFVFFWWINLHPEGVSWSSLISSFIGDRHWEDWCYQESVSVIVSSLTNDSSVFCVSLNYLSDGLITSITLCLCPSAFQASTHLIFFIFRGTMPLKLSTLKYSHFFYFRHDDTEAWHQIIVISILSLIFYTNHNLPLP